MARKAPGFGERANGIVCDENDWGGKNPPMIRPRKRVWGTVNRVFPAAPNVVGVETMDGEHYVIRTDV